MKQARPISVDTGKPWTAMALKPALLAAISVYFLSFGLIAATVGDQPTELVEDEDGFLRTGMILAPAFWQDLRAGDFAGDPRWRQWYAAYGNVNPRIGLFFLGAVGHTLRLEPLDPHGIRRARWAMAAVSAGCVLLIFLLAKNAGSLMAGGLSAALLLLHPVFRSIQTAILPDMPMALFVLLALLSLQHLETNLRMRRLAWTWVLAFGLFAGLATATKLYAAAVYPVFLFVVGRHAAVNANRRRLLVATATALALGAAVFVVTNPLLYNDLRSGLRLMTTDHLTYLHQDKYGTPAGNHPEAFGLILRYPFIVFRGAPFDISILHGGPAASEVPAIVCGYLLCGLGLMGAIRRRRYLPIAWLFAGFAISGAVVLSLGAKWAMAKVFLLPALGVIWIASQGWVWLTENIGNRLKKNSALPTNQ